MNLETTTWTAPRCTHEKLAQAHRVQGAVQQFGDGFCRERLSRAWLPVEQEDAAPALA